LKEEPPKDKDKDSKRPTPIQIAPRGQSLWKECKFWGNNIAVRSYGSASVAGDKLYVFGGQQLLGGVLDDFYSVQLNIDAEHTPGYEWKKEPTANGPGKRARHVALVQGTNIYFHGGIKPGFVTTSDFFMFDTKGSTWTMIKSADSPCLDSHSGVVFGDKMFYFCGLDGK
jgi:N-acetylneuraminic acid mutarotase